MTDDSLTRSHYQPYVHNSGMIDRNPNMDKTKYTAWLNNVWIREETKAALRDLRLNVQADFNSGSFHKKHLITGKSTLNIYYRKMSQAEYNTIKGKTDPFKPVFDYKNTDLYRYWVSSSLKKVQEFGNEASTDDGDIIIKIEFNQDPRRGFDLRPHQQPGVQANSNVAAMHREGFAELSNIIHHEQVEEIILGNFDHNLGFTSKQHPKLHQTIKNWEVVG